MFFNKPTRIRQSAAILVVLLLLGWKAHTQQQSMFTLLPDKEARSVRQFRLGEGFGKSGWMPTNENIKSLEGNLPKIAMMKPDNWRGEIRIGHPDAYLRQYVGVIVSGRKLVYVNAFCRLIPPPPDWRDHLHAVMDGGSCYWQVLFDPGSQEFSRLTVNGTA